MPMMRCDPWRWLERSSIWGRTEGSVASEQISSVVLYMLQGSPWTRLSSPPCLVPPLPRLRVLLGGLLYTSLVQILLLRNPKKDNPKSFPTGDGGKRKEVKKPEAREVKPPPSPPFSRKRLEPGALRQAKKGGIRRCRVCLPSE